MEEKFEDTEGVIRSRKSYDRQNMVSKKRNKKTHNDPQVTTYRTYEIEFYS